jgi:hypothetical protein
MLIDRFRALRKWFVVPKSNYKIGEAVRLRGTNEMMVVVEVWSHRGMDEAQVHCHFNNPNSTFESDLFPESAIEPYN